MGFTAIVTLFLNRTYSTLSTYFELQSNSKVKLNFTKLNFTKFVTL